MRKLISKFIIKLIGRKNFLDSVDIDALNRKISSNKIAKCGSQVSKKNSSRFYDSAVVYNHQSDKSKISIGENTHIRGELLVFKYGGEINIGNNCFIGEGSRIWSGDSLLIGNDVLISHNVNIVDTNSHEIGSLDRVERYKELLLTGHWKSKGSIITSPVVIKDNAWISFGVSILKGTTIGKGAIIGAGSIVTKDVPDWTIVAGNPAQIVREIPENER